MESAFERFWKDLAEARTVNRIRINYITCGSTVAAFQNLSNPFKFTEIPGNGPRQANLHKNEYDLAKKKKLERVDALALGLHKAKEAERAAVHALEEHTKQHGCRNKPGS